MTTVEKDAALMVAGCTLVEDKGAFALVYPYGYEGRKRAHDLAAKGREAAIVEAWDWLHPEEQIAERIEIIQRVVAHEFGTTAHDLCNGGRTEPLATARRVAMALCRKLTPASTTLVGASFNGRDHGTVLHAERSIAAECENDARFGARVGIVFEACRTAIATTREKGAA
jgi:hypothetical protein